MRPDDPVIAKAWRRRARQLAGWAAHALVNRCDAWGAYVAPGRRVAVGKRSWTAPPKKDRGRVELTKVRLAAHFAAFDLGHVIGLHAVSPTGTCRWGAIDIDRHGGPEDPSADITFEAARFWFEVLVSLGFSPLLTDSNGNGGFHLRVLFDTPIPAARAYWFLRWLVADHQARRIPRRPETYPRAPELPAGGFGNWLRVPGRHHTNPDHWSRVWDGARWLEGNEAINVIVDSAGDRPSLIPAEAAPPKPKPRPQPVPLPDNIGDIVKRCEAYIARLPDAISGARGHDKTFHAACECFRFGLDDSSARGVMERFNAGRTGGEHWSDAELAHKLAGAKARVQAEGDFGRRLRGGGSRPPRGGPKHTLTVAPLRAGASR